MFLKSILKVFSGAFGMIFRVMVIILLCFLAGWCFGVMLTVPFLWEGLIRLAAIAACVLLIRFFLFLGREKDDGPVEDDFRS